MWLIFIGFGSNSREINLEIIDYWQTSNRYPYEQDANWGHGESYHKKNIYIKVLIANKKSDYM